ncbi:hypothetical protein CEXT_579451 [Caerostris extrusa]|uniref:Uncharacterized protein n=1 Tax=Caerostris extrusa TaxID=172846 RepID=A0AAV4V174_CAEEX|nr:hypothetical protein CEXT_579451 [Caerostris extrusa]
MHLHRDTCHTSANQKGIGRNQKAKELQLQLAAEAATKEVPPPPPAPTMPEQSNATKWKTPTTDDDDKGFQKVVTKKKDKKRGVNMAALSLVAPTNTP